VSTRTLKGVSIPKATRRRQINLPRVTSVGYCRLEKFFVRKNLQCQWLGNYTIQKTNQSQRDQNDSRYKLLNFFDPFAPSQRSQSFLPSEDADEIGGTRKPAGPSDFGNVVLGSLEQVAGEVDSLAGDPGIERNAPFRTESTGQMVRRAPESGGECPHTEILTGYFHANDFFNLRDQRR